MNKFRANLHPALFKEPVDKTPEIPELSQTGKELNELGLDVATKKIERKNNETAASEVEKMKIADEDLSNLLKQLAKNKKLNFSRTNDRWQCSLKEKNLGSASARIFLQLLEQSQSGGENQMKKIISLCKNYNGEFTRDIASQWKSELGINSKEEDIKSFYESFMEYQNPQSSYSHLKELMGFFCERGIDTIDKLKDELSTQSQKITSQEIREAGKNLYKEVSRQSEYGHVYTAIIDLKTNQEISRKPRNREQEARYMVIKDRLSTDQISAKDKMLMLLGDYNLDGEINRGDVGFKTGSQLMTVFNREVEINKMSDKNFGDDKAVQNLVEYANEYGLDIQGVSSVENLYEWMTKWPEGYENTRKLQKFMQNLSIDLGDILRNGKNAGEESLKNMTSALNLEKKEEEAAKEAAKQKAKETVKSNEAKLKEVIKDARERANITQQLLSDLPGMLINKALEQQGMMSAGVRIPLDEIIKGSSAGLSVGIDDNGKLNLGLFVGWDHRWDLSKDVDLSAAVNAGTTLGFIPILAASTELGVDANRKSREESLDVKGMHRVSLGGNVTMYGPIFSRGVSTGFENNKQAGIEKNANNIKSQINKMMSDPETGLLKSGDLSEESIKERLSKKFGNTSSEQLNLAAKNLMDIIKQFKIDEKTTESDINTYAQVIADVYSEQWRNIALTGIVDNKRKLSGGKVGVQFFAGVVPTVTVVAKFTRYHNARTNETEHSRSRRIDANVNGVGNEKLRLDDGRIGATQVNQINELLKKYGAKSELKFVPGVAGKPGKVAVPVSLVEGMGVNVRVAKTMEGYVKKENGNYLFPTNTTYRLLTETGGDQGSLTINIGADKTDTDNDILLSDEKGMDALLGDGELLGQKRREFVEGSEFKSVDDVLSYESDIIKELFSDQKVVEGLKRVDSSDWRRFSEFMKTKKDQNADFSSMIKALTDVLSKNKMYDTIVNKLNDANVSNTDKQLIIDRVMAISADANVHQQYGLEAVVNGNKEVKGRGNTYKSEKMVGPNGKSIFNEINVDRNELVKKIHEGKNYNPELQTNLLGATAFYHRNNTAKGLAMTGLGATTVLGGQTKEISGGDKTIVERWFLGNEGQDPYVPGVLDKSPAEWSHLKSTISDYIKKQNINFKTDAGIGVLTDNQLKKLLKGEEVELSLDNSSEKVIVNLDVKYMFYLMGECANESVGMQLGKLSVKRMAEVQDYEEGSLFINRAEGSSSVNASRKDVAAGAGFKAGNEGEEAQPADTDPRTTEVPNSNPGTTPDGGTPDNPTPPNTANPNGNPDTTTGGGRDD